MPAKKATKKVATAKSITKKVVIRKTTASKTSTLANASNKTSNSIEKAPKAAKPELSSKKIQNSSSFAKAESKAKEYINNPKKLGKLFEEAAIKSKQVPKGPFGETWAYLQAMIRLIRAYANGSYREIPVASLLMVLVAVIYFVSPIDLIPDFIPVAGYIDDALVVSLAINQVKIDLDAFMQWEIETTSSRV